MSDFTFLTEEQCFGDKKLDILKKRGINKIVFTDGYPCPGTMPKEDLKKENVIWIVYGNKNFNPCCGKVINITEKQLEKLNLDGKNNSMYETTR